jgi:hypothetical protein
VDLSVAFDGRSPDDLIVNALDVHPNERTHAEVAALIADELGSTGWTRAKSAAGHRAFRVP